MAKSANRVKIMADKRANKEAFMKKNGGRSRYALKRKYLDKNGGFGSDYATKPWKSQ